MMGQRRFAPKLYYQLSLDNLVPQGHLLRRIALCLDFSFIYPLARPYYSHTGRPPVDPIVFFKARLIGYLYGVTSERRLMAEVQVHLANLWFLGYDVDEVIPGQSQGAGGLLLELGSQSGQATRAPGPSHAEGRRFTPRADPREADWRMASPVSRSNRRIQR